MRIAIAQALAVLFPNETFQRAERRQRCLDFDFSEECKRGAAVSSARLRFSKIAIWSRRLDDACKATRFAIQTTASIRHPGAGRIIRSDVAGEA